MGSQLDFSSRAEIGAFLDDALRSESTVVGGGAFECYQRLFGDSDRAAELNENDGANTLSAREPGTHRHRVHQAQPSSQAHSNSRGKSRCRRSGETSTISRPHARKSGNPRSLRAHQESYGPRSLHGRSKRRATVTPPESASDNPYDSSSDSDLDESFERTNGHGSAMSKGTRKSRRGRSKAPPKPHRSNSRSLDADKSSDSLSSDSSLSNSSADTGSPNQKVPASTRPGRAGMSASSSSGFSSDDYQLSINNRLKGRSKRARSTSRVRFNPEVEIQSLSTRDNKGVSDVKCKSCSTRSTESKVPKSGGVAGLEPLKTQNGGRSTLQEINANAAREAERRARSQQVYDSMFGSSTVGGGAAGWKDPSSSVAGFPNGGPSGSNGYNYHQNRGNPGYSYGNYNSQVHKQSDQYGQYPVSGFETYYDDPYGNFNYQSSGGHLNDGEYVYDPYIQQHGAQEYDAYSQGLYEPACTEPGYGNGHDASRANFASPFSNAQ